MRFWMAVYTQHYPLSLSLTLFEKVCVCVCVCVCIPRACVCALCIPRVCVVFSVVGSPSSFQQYCYVLLYYYRV